MQEMLDPLLLGGRGDPLTSGSCPAGGTHVRVDWRYVLPVTEAGSDGQTGLAVLRQLPRLVLGRRGVKGNLLGGRRRGIHLHGVLDRDGKVFDPFTGPSQSATLAGTKHPTARSALTATMYVFAGFPEPQYSHRNRGGDRWAVNTCSASANPSVPGRYKLEFRLSPKLGWCTLDAARTTVDAHFVMGFRFVVSHSIAPSVSRSTGWHVCSKCQAIYSPGSRACVGTGGGHVPVDSTDYGFEIGDFDDVQNQSHFHRCGEVPIAFLVSAVRPE